MATLLTTLVRPGADRMEPVDFDFDEEFRLLEARIDGRLRVARMQDRFRGAVDAVAAVWSGLTTPRQS